VLVDEDRGALLCSIGECHVLRLGMIYLYFPLMCDCATKYMMNAKVYLGKENNEVARGLASDVCTLVQPISGQDRSCRNVTTDNFFTSIYLANRLKNKKIDTCWDNEAKKKEKFHKISTLPGNVMKTRLFLDLPRISHFCQMSQRRTNQLSSFHHSIMIQQSAAIQESLKSLNFVTKKKVQYACRIKRVQGTQYS